MFVLRVGLRVLRGVDTDDDASALGDLLCLMHNNKAVQTKHRMTAQLTKSLFA